MRKIVVSQFMSLDGVMEAPETWHFPFISDDMMQEVERHINTSDAALYGRKTYDIFAGFWPNAPESEAALATKLNSQPKYVVSTTLKKVDWNNTTIIKDNVAGEISKLKQQSDGTIAVTGSATLIQTLMQADLIDEYLLYIHPIVLGKGMRLFRDGNIISLKLVESKPFNGGVVLLRYQPERQ